MLTTDLERGGLPLRLVRLAPRLREVNVEPIVGCLAPAGPLSGELESAGIETFSCDARGSYDLACLSRLMHHVRRIDPDLIHASLFHANMAARLVGRLDRPRPILTSTVTIEVERGWHRWLEALTWGGSDLHVANSKAVAVHLCEELGLPHRRVIVVPNGVDISRLDAAPTAGRQALGLDDDVPLILWAGRMDPVKDLETFVEVVDRLNRRIAVRALLLGDGPERGRVQALIRRKGLDSVIHLALWSEEVASWMKASDVLLFPSRTEGAPNVILEAMVCGCPVVASDLPATRELIDSGVHGVLCPKGDVDGFAARLTEVVLDGELRARLAAAARRRVVGRHDLRHVVPLWRRTYDSVMSGP